MTLVPLRKLPKSTPNITELRDDDSETLAADDRYEDGDNDNDGFDLDDDGANEDDEDDKGPITGKTYTPQQYWNYVDDYLEYIRTELFADITDRSVRNAKMMQYVLVLAVISHPLSIC